MGRLVVIGNIEVRVFANDHLPPHFHVITPDYQGRFSIADLTAMDVDVTPAIRRRAWGWIVENRASIAAEWTRLHPDFPAA